MSGASEVVRVLLVDDDPDDYELVVDLLAQSSNGRRYEVEWLDSCAGALAALTQKSYDICLLDCFLGADDGLELLEQASRSGSRVPIIVLTGRGNAGVEHRALASGAADYLVKGEMDVEALARSIRHALERARSAQTLSERDQQFRAVFEAALDAMLIANDEGYYVDANGAALSLIGVTRERLISMHMTDLSPPEAREATLQSWAVFLREGRLEGEFRLRRPDGTDRIVEFRAAAQVTPGRHLSVMRDVTARKLAESQRLRLAAMVESAADAIEGITLDGAIDYWSPAAERTYGYAAEEALGRPKRFVVPDEKVPELEAMLERVRQGECIRNHETVRRRKDGSTFEASVTLSPVWQGSQIVAASVITRDIAEKKKLEAHLAVTERMASVGTLAAGVAHEINNPLAALIGSLDLLAYSLSAVSGDPELSAPDQDDSQAMEMLASAVTTFPPPRAVEPYSGPRSQPPPGLRDASSVPLRAVTPQIEGPVSLPPVGVVARSSQPRALMELSEPLADARCAADRIRQIVRDLKLFSKPDEERSGPVDLRRVIDSASRMAWNEIRHRARLVKDYGDVPPVQGSDGRLGQVFLNLIINAAQAIREGDAARNEIRIVTRSLDDGQVVAEIRDTGEGIASGRLERLFEPFFTTKPVGIGTGLGLSICRRIVDAHGGTITVESEPGRGTTFRVALPAARQQEQSPLPAMAPRTLRGGRRGRVLVIDDEPTIARLVTRLLERNHNVTAVSDGAAALKLLRESTAYDVIICDMMMPQMSGKDFYEALSKMSAESASRVVFLTGGAFTLEAREFLDRVPNQRIEKPFDGIHLRGVVDDRVSALTIEEAG